MEQKEIHRVWFNFVDFYGEGDECNVDIDATFEFGKELSCAEFYSCCKRAAYIYGFALETVKEFFPEDY